MAVSTILPEVILLKEDEFKKLDGNKFANVYLVRHQETQENITRGWGNRINSQLTEEGVKQAQKGAEELHKRIGLIDAIYASESQRTYESAQPLAELCKLPCCTISHFQESNHGCLTGLTREAQHAVMSKNLAYYEKRKKATKLQKFFVYPVAPDAELAYHVVQRVTKALTDLAKKHTGETVVVFGHGGPIQKLKYLHFIQQCEKNVIPESAIPDEIESPKHGEAWHLMVSDRQIYILV